uniref:Thiamine-monophosphate kinase n=1 Tax=uncultured marine crenarchaeote HF4000_APKG6B14 TaxID=455594 RepID=B3T8Q3_9ARCH|nr:putative AIR synthase related protein, N-terminal domain protein [uncultured marine crenarchaeote HF4000_APKG6B14]
MSKLSEKKIIELFQNRLGNTNFVPEDVESFKIGKKRLVAKVDTLVESTDVPPGMKLEDVARKSIVSCVSDFAAKGVKPIFGIVSLTIPKRLSRSNIESLAKGFQRAAGEFKLKILGGDTNEGKELVINFSLFGISEKIVNRKGAKTNHVIITSGPFGYSGAGLSILLKNKNGSKKFKAKAKSAVFRPNCRLTFGLKNKNYFSSSMDSSDGLSTTLNEMSTQSKKKFVITRMPSENDVFDFASSNGLNANDLIFNGGEEYEIVATANTSNLTRIKKYAKKHRIKLYEIGYVTKGSGVFYKKDGKLIRIKDKGWQHLQKS